MFANFGSGISLQSGTKPFFSIFKPQRNSLQIINLSQTLTMATLSSPDNRRPTCPSCSRPTRFCLCTRLKTPVLDNSISISILQHSLEKKHPLNSAKIATLGLKNVDLASVSDVISEAHFDLYLLESNLEMGLNDSAENRKKIESFSFQPSDISFNIEKKGILKSNLELGLNDSVENGKKIESLEPAAISYSIEKKGILKSNLELGLNDSVENLKKFESLQPAAISFTIEKKGILKSVNHIWSKKNETHDLDELLVDQEAIDALRNGFLVKKIQKNRDQDYVQDFEMVIPSRSVLLFPSDDSIAIEDIDFDIKNLIVLDGTWSKATKMYKENPWLKFLPRVKLDIEKLSLYGEVRRQPKTGCLSSIESIVYALKAIGEDLEGLDGLLDVLESMVVDQRRCKDERLKESLDF